MRIIFSRIFLLSMILGALVGAPVNAQTINLDASQLVSRAELSLSPRTGTFVEGSTFDVPILVNTKGTKINGIEVRINFDKDKLEITKSSSGLSIIGVWIEPSGYDNSRGTASYVGVIPNGITAESGLIGTLTFKAKKIGRAVVTFNANSKVLLNDGQGTGAEVEFGRGEYIILPKAPEGVNIFSETHPYSSEWYNNNSPTVSWERDPGVSGFSYILDNLPNTIPESVVNTEETTKPFNKLADGLWYFHIKAIKNGAWGTAGHFLIRIDTTPPAEFKPEVNYLLAAVLSTERALVSFFTTDDLSGINRYEVGVIDKGQSTTISPNFVQSDSPFQIPLTGGDLNVIVRAIDNAGNLRDVSIFVTKPTFFIKFLKDNIVYILLLVLLIGLVTLIIHYIVGHHILKYIGKVRELMRKNELANGETHDIDKGTT